MRTYRGDAVTRNQRRSVVAVSPAIPFHTDAGTGPLPGTTAQPGSGPASRCAVLTHWLRGRSLARASLAGLAVWVLVASANLASAIIQRHDGAWIVIATAAVMLLAALVSSIAGFAFSALAGSALAYLEMDAVHAVQTMVLCSIAIQLYAVLKIRESIRWSQLWPMIAAGTATIPLGVWLLAHVDGSVYILGLGVFLTAYGFYGVMRRESWALRGNAWLDAAAGALGGIAGGLAGFPGSFVTIWCSMRGWDKHRQRAVYQPYILVMQGVTIVCLRWQAPAHASVAQDLSFVPFALLGAIGGLAVFQRISNKQFHVAVSLLLVACGIGMLARALRESPPERSIRNGPAVGS